MRERDYAAPLLAPIRRRKVRNRDGPRPRPSWRAVRFARTDSAPQSADGLSQCKNQGNKARMSMKTKDRGTANGDGLRGGHRVTFESYPSPS